ncbi:hypothetical protein ACG0Z6_16075 [Roseateles sp. BYS180W]|uniref:Uncharacterized protein n=1 Tax=Roseateles rivi TaxID=3299028 RepID=A0ABW7FZE9_9BURK
MWKLAVAFVAFAAVVLYVMSRSDVAVDIGGEKHDVSGGHTEAASAAATEAPAASAAVLTAPASAAASGASQ